MGTRLSPAFYNNKLSPFFIVFTYFFGEYLVAQREPQNLVDRYAVAVKSGENVVGHLRKGVSGRFAKLVSYFLNDQWSSCRVAVLSRPINLGDRDGMQVPCKLYFAGQEQYIQVLRQQLRDINEL